MQQDPVTASGNSGARARIWPAIVAGLALATVWPVWLQAEVWQAAAAGLVAFAASVPLRRKGWVLALTAEAAVVVTGVWLTTQITLRAVTERDEISMAGARALDLAAYVPNVPVSPVGDADFALVLPLVDGLDSLQRDLRPDAFRAAFPHEARLGDTADRAYRDAVDRVLLPRVLVLLERVLRQGAADDPGAQFPALAAYLMLGKQIAINETLVDSAVGTALLAHWPGEGLEEARQAVLSHLAAVSPGAEGIALDVGLVASVRAQLVELPASELVYLGVIGSAGANAFPDWRLAEVAGPALDRTFVRKSGGAAGDIAIPGIFTRAGMHHVILPTLFEWTQGSNSVAEIIGLPGEPDETTGKRQLFLDSLALYERDYASRYAAALADLAVAPAATPEQAAEIGMALSGPTSPLVLILDSVAYETRLTEPPENAGRIGKLSEAAARMLELQGQDAAAPPGDWVEAEFAWLHYLVAPGAGDGPSPLDQIVVALQDAATDLQRIAFVGAADGTMPGLDALTSLAREVPEPVSGWLTAMAQLSGGAVAVGAADLRWQQEIMPVCRAALDGRYPFDTGSAVDVSMSDFAELFRPEGTLDRFFAEELATLVDTSQRPWTSAGGAPADAALSEEALAMFEQAARIRRAYFAEGSFGLRLFVTPFAMDEQATSATLSISGTRIVVERRVGPSTGAGLFWPWPTGDAMIVIEPQLDGQPNIAIGDGTWGLFRLLDQAQIRRTALAETARVTFTVGGRLVAFDIRLAGPENVVADDLLTGFRCPDRLR